MGKTQISVIGSCRVYSPIEKVVLSSNFQLGHNKTDWFTHSTRDVIQKIDILNNEIALPDYYIPLVINDKKKYFPSEHKKAFFFHTDIFVIEISSIQSNKLDGFELQQWCVRDLKGSDNEECEKILDRIESKIMSATDIISDLEKIYQMLQEKPIVFVSHNMLEKPDGTIPKPRPIIKQALEDFSLSKANVYYFDPTPTILKHGVDVAMKDPAHYKTDFEIVMGREILSEVERCL